MFKNPFVKYINNPLKFNVESIFFLFKKLVIQILFFFSIQNKLQILLFVTLHVETLIK